MFYRFCLCLFLSFFSFKTLHAERFLYVDDFKNILDNPTRKTALLVYAQSHQITELILYELHLVNTVHNLSNAASNQILADFIKSAKTNYGVTRMSAAGESANWFQNNIITYNATRNLATEKFDALGLEFEFWTPSAVSMYYCADYLTPNNLTCDNAGAFTFCKNQLTQMKTLTAASAHPMSVEMYVGWPNAAQLLQLSAVADRMFIHAYVLNPSTSFNYALERLSYYANYNSVANVYIIFSSEPNFMQPWLLNHSMSEAETVFTTAYNATIGPWKNHVNFAGFVYFTYTFQTTILLPINWLKINAKRDNKTIKLTWEMENTNALKAFNIDYSLDGKSWKNRASLNANERQYIDNQVNTNKFYYRINAIMINGDVEISPIISVESTAFINEINAFPNPFNDVINLPNVPIEKAYLIDSKGQNQLVTIVNNQIKNLNNLPKGLYVLSLLTGGNWYQIKLVK